MRAAALMTDRAGMQAIQQEQQLQWSSRVIGQETIPVPMIPLMIDSEHERRML